MEKINEYVVQALRAPNGFDWEWFDNECLPDNIKTDEEADDWYYYHYGYDNNYRLVKRTIHIDVIVLA